MITRRPALLHLALVVSLASLSCERERPAPPAPAPSALAVAPAPSAVDRVDPDEVPEGAERAFGLPIPRAMRVDERYPDAVRAEGEVPYAALTAYVRARVVASRVTPSVAKTVFAEATLKSAPDKLLRVEIVSYGLRTALIVRDLTPPPATDVVRPTDPWDKPGFDPRDGKADPSRFE